MKHTLSIIIALLFAPIIAVQADDLTRSISIVPTPVQMVPGEGSYRFSDQTVFAVENSGQAEVVRNFIKLFTRAAGFTPQLKEGSAAGGDVCCVTDRNLKSEAYRLEVTPNRIVMKASDTKGFFYALQTIRLLLPSSIENARNVGGNPDWTIPSVKISDEPRFGYRGLLLDAARFFIPKENVLRIMDCMAMLKCPLCQARMKKEHLTHEEDLQGYFMKRMCEYVQSKGREVIGWDELTNSTIPDGTIILGWQGMGTAALKAAELGHPFIMTPARIMYLIRYQGPQWFEPVTYFGNNTLRNVFDYEPVQEDWKPEYTSLLMGVQGSMWTEFCNKPEDVDYLLFPRLAAVAERAWTKPELKDWNGFLKGLDVYNSHIAVKGVGYSRSMYNIQHTVTSVDGALQVNLECIRPDVEIHYTLDNREPSVKSPRYTQCLTVKNAQVLRCATFKDGKQMGKTLILPVIWNKATGKPVLGDNKNEIVMTNGIRGSLKQTDYEWSSWEKSDHISFTIDLQKKEILNTLTLGCITNYGMAIHKPAVVKVEVSDDNRKFREIGILNFTSEEIFREGNFIEDLSLDMGGIQARYIRITAEGPGACPEDHVRPGQESRVMFDEVMVE